MGYAQEIGAFGYSSGESVMASTDAQNVDFGIPVDPRQHFIATRPNRPSSPDYVLNGTPENITSNYGCVIYPFGGLKNKQERGVPVALGTPKNVPSVAMGNGPITGVASGQGLSRTGAMRPLDATLTIGGPGLMSQRENIVRHPSLGQLDGLRLN